MNSEKIKTISKYLAKKNQFQINEVYSVSQNILFKTKQKITNNKKEIEIKKIPQKNFQQLHSKQPNKNRVFDKNSINFHQSSGLPKNGHLQRINKHTFSKSQYINISLNSWTIGTNDLRRLDIPNNYEDKEKF